MFGHRASRAGQCVTTVRKTQSAEHFEQMVRRTSNSEIISLSYGSRACGRTEIWTMTGASGDEELAREVRKVPW